MQQQVNEASKARVGQILQDTFASDPEWQTIANELRTNSDKGQQHLNDYLKQRLSDDEQLREALINVQDIPPRIHTEVSGGQIDKLVQIAEAGAVYVNTTVDVAVVLPEEKQGWWSWRQWLMVLGLLLLLLAGTIAGYTYYYSYWPMPVGGINVAVSKFVLLDENGNTKITEQSTAFSETLYKAIDREMQLLPVDLQFDLHPPGRTGAVHGADQDSRAANAEELATRLNASILIYGVISEDDTGLHIAPEFYVHDETFNYGKEVAGPNRLGDPIPISDLANTEVEFAFNERLQARTQILRQFVSGLAYLSIGQHDEAIAKFRSAASNPHWADEEGKEVAYLLIGAAKLRSYDPIANNALLSEASSAFATAQQLNGDYARSYLGLGATALEQAKLLNSAGKIVGVDEMKLAEAERDYLDSMGASDQPELAYVPVRAAYGLGQINLVAFEQGINDTTGQVAWDYYTFVIDSYAQESEPPSLAWLAANAHAERGRLSGHLEEYADMATEYRQAITIIDGMSDEPRTRAWQARYWTAVAFAEEQQGHLDAAREAYRSAISTGKGYVGEEELIQWQEALSELEEKGDE